MADEYDDDETGCCCDDCGCEVSPDDMVFGLCGDCSRYLAQAGEG